MTEKDIREISVRETTMISNNEFNMGSSSNRPDITRLSVDSLNASIKETDRADRDELMPRFSDR